MSSLADIFKDGCKVVISPDQMRAWITLSRPSGGAYTAAAIMEWLPQNGVVYGASAQLVQDAAASGRYNELLEVARGKAPVAAAAGSYTLLVDKKPFTGLRANSDGSLIYDDLSFLQEAQPDQILAEVVPADPGKPGKTVTGEEVPPKAAENDQTLSGSGYVVTDDGRYYRAPALSHVNIVNNELVVTPLLKLDSVTEADGPMDFDGNIVVEKDVSPGASLTASGSIFVAGRCASAKIKAGNNLLLCFGMRSQGGFGTATAKENVWGQVFESAEIRAGGDVCTNLLSGCETTADGRASILGGRGAVIGGRLSARSGVVAGQLGNEQSTKTLVRVGMDGEILERYEGVEKRLAKMALDVQAIQQNMTAFERINRNKPDKGQSDPQYKEMKTKRDQMLSIVNILNTERGRLKRTIESFSTVAVTVRDTAFPGVTIEIDTRTMNVLQPLRKVKFKRSNDTIETISAATR